MISPEVIGFIAGGLSASVFVPQIMKIIKEKSAEELKSNIETDLKMKELNKQIEELTKKIEGLEKEKQNKTLNNKCETNHL